MKDEYVRDHAPACGCVAAGRIERRDLYVYFFTSTPFADGDLMVDGERLIVATLEDSRETRAIDCN